MKRSITTLGLLALALMVASAAIPHHKPDHRKLSAVAKCPGTVKHIARTKTQTWKIQDRIGEARHVASARHPSSYLSCKYLRWVAAQWRGRLNEARETLASLSTVEGAIRHVWGAEAGNALKVAWCESNYSVYARNGQYLGLFQMGDWARSNYGHGWDALTQARAAYRLWLDEGWSQWECSPHGAFRD